MNKLYPVIRFLIGVFLLVVSGAKFGILPNGTTRPALFTADGFAFISAIDATGYIFPTVGLFSLLCGLAFIFNRYAALAAVVMVPITLNFALFHVFMGLEVSSLFSFEFVRESIGFIPIILMLYIIYNERSKYAALLKA